MTAIDERILAENLVNALRLLGVAVTPQFRVPGTTQIIDLFIPTVPRAAIEIMKKLSSHGLAHLQRAQQMFGGRINTFLIWLGNQLPANVETEINTNPFISFIPVTDSNQSADEIASYIAKEISDTLNNVRTHRYHIPQKERKLFVREAAAVYGPVTKMKAPLILSSMAPRALMIRLKLLQLYCVP